MPGLLFEKADFQQVEVGTVSGNGKSHWVASSTYDHQSGPNYHSESHKPWIDTRDNRLSPFYTNLSYPVSCPLRFQNIAYALGGGGWFQVCLWPDSNGENSLIGLGIGKNFIGLRTASKQINMTTLGLQHLKMEIRFCCKLIFEHIFHFIA